MLLKSNCNIEDIKYIIDNLRQEDIEEVKILFGDDWKSKTFDNIMSVPDCDIIIGKNKENVPVVMCGAVENDSKNASGVACVWLLSTEEIVNHKHSFLRQMINEFKKYDEKYYLTYNVIHKKNFSAKKWLKRFGFRFDIKELEYVNLPKDFEFFYRLRPIQGLG